MANVVTAADDAPLLFCPFCRECYEGKTHCPEHELELVSFEALPKQAHERQAVGWDDPIPPTDLRYGRVWIALGAALAAAGFFLPFASGTAEGRTTAWTGMKAAMGPAPNLWTVPFVAVMFVVLLYRRRTPREMRSARLAALLLSVMPLASVLYSAWNVQRGVAAAHGALALSWGSGVWIIGAATVMFAIGALRFGAIPKDASLPHGAAPDSESDEPRIDTERPRKRRGRR